MLNSAKQMEVVSEKPGEQLKKLRVNEGVNLFIEDKTVPFPKEQDPTQAHLNEEEAKEESSKSDLTKWEQEFVLETNRFTIKFNDPFEKLVLETAGMNAREI